MSLRRSWGAQSVGTGERVPMLTKFPGPSVRRLMWVATSGVGADPHLSGVELVALPGSSQSVHTTRCANCALSVAVTAGLGWQPNPNPFTRSSLLGSGGAAGYLPMRGRTGKCAGGYDGCSAAPLWQNGTSRIN